jgi:hypothetical protein
MFNGFVSSMSPRQNVRVPAPAAGKISLAAAGIL